MPLDQTPDQIAFTTPFTKATLGTVHVVDKSGATYVFPDMNVTELRRVIPENGRVPSGLSCLCMVNTSMSVLSIPIRNVQEIRVDEEVIWHA